MIDDKERLKDFLKEIINQRQETQRTSDRVDFHSFVSCNARADLATDILEILENGFHDIDYEVRCGDKVFNRETKKFE